VLSDGAPEEIRTPDPQIRSLVLYPAELRALDSTTEKPGVDGAIANVSSIHWQVGFSKSALWASQRFCWPGNRNFNYGPIASGTRVRRAIAPISDGAQAAPPKSTARPIWLAARPDTTLASRTILPTNKRAAVM
jgi:hypothetical protein